MGLILCFIVHIEIVSFQAESTSLTSELILLQGHFPSSHLEGLRVGFDADSVPVQI